MVSCPLAMTDGAATTLTSLLRNSPSSSSEHWRSTLTTTLAHLTSRDPSQFWTSGQWMTERAGGSDVTRATDTRAELGEDGVYRLYGNKFYTSAIDCRVSLALARNGEALSLFLVNLPKGKLWESKTVIYILIRCFVHNDSEPQISQFQCLMALLRWRN